MVLEVKMDVLNSIHGLLSDASVQLGLLIIFLFIVYRQFFVSRNNDIPPGPKFRLPILGQLYAVEPDMRIFLRKYRKQYGDIYSLYFGSKLVIFIAGYDKLKEAFVKNGTMFSYRPKDDTIIDKITKRLGIASTDGNLWKEHRKFSLATLRHFGMGKSILEDRIHSEVKALLKTFDANGSKSYNPENTIYIGVSNIISSIAFGAHFNHRDSRAREMIQKIKDNFENVGNSSLGTFIPSLALLPGDLFKIKAVLNNAEAVLGFLHEFILEHMQRYDENDINDFTSAFIKEMKLQQSSKESTTFTVDQLTMVIADFFIAGTETTSSALRWALVYLVNYPDIQEQLFQNIRDNVGTDNLPSVQDKTKLPLVEAFIMECLRHANITITSLPHATSQDVLLDGYRIPSDAIILADLDSVNSDRAKWKDPEVFRPHRFINKDGSLLGVEEFTPFFLGKRSCIGESLAKMEMFLFLSAIVQNYKITAPPGEDLSLDTVDGVFGLTHVPKPFNILATPRTKH